MAADVPSSEVPTSQMPGAVVEVGDTVGNLRGQLHSPTVIRRKGVGKTGALASMKHSASTPDVRGLGDMEDSNMSMAEKRRNKLGYHRTSIACSMWTFPDEKARFR